MTGSEDHRGSYALLIASEVSHARIAIIADRLVSGSPVPSGPWSRNAHSGWKPNPRLNVGAACSFSECAVTSVASTSITSGSAASRPWSGAWPPASSHARGPRGGCRRRDRGQRRRGVGGEPIDQPGHRRTGGHRTEHLRRGPQLCDVGQAVTADRQRHRQIQQHLARIVPGQRRPPRTGRLAESSVETDRFRGAEQEYGAGVRHDAGAPPVGCQTGITAATILHQKGAPVPARLWS
jgi:hypothetical protein